MVFCKKSALKSFSKFTWKHLCKSLLRPATLLKRRLCHKWSFSCEFCEIFKNNFFRRTPLWLFLYHYHKKNLFKIVEFIILWLPKQVLSRRVLESFHSEKFWNFHRNNAFLSNILRFCGWCFLRSRNFNPFVPNAPFQKPFFSKTKRSIKLNIT